MGRVILGAILGVALAPVALWAWFSFGCPPVAVADKPLPMESLLNSALHVRVGREAAKAKTALKPDEETLLAGARIYRDQCAACHGFHGKPSPFSAHMYPAAPALWEKAAKGDAIGVSDNPPAEIFWKVNNGIRLTGMPSYHNVIPETQIWQVCLLLANANKPLPAEAVMIVRGEQPPAPAPAPDAPQEQPKP